MANKRIKDLTNEATSATLDANQYAVVDGSTGTFKTKLSALSDWIHGRWASFVNALTAKTSFASGDKIAVVNGSTATAMGKDSLLLETAQNTLAGNVAPAFDPTRTNANPYAIGDFVTYNGSLYRFIASHYGAWNASHVIGGTYDELKNLEQGLSFSIVGGNLTVKNKYVFLPKGVDYIGIEATPNPWPTDTIGGTNPGILIVYAVASDGTETTKAQYNISQVVPEVVNISVPSTAVMLRIFIRANNGANVSFDVYNNVQKQLADIGQNISNLGTELSAEELLSVSTRNYVFGSSLSVEGKNTTAVQSAEYDVIGLSEVVVDFSSSASWPTTSLTIGMQKFWFQVYNGSWTTVSQEAKDSVTKKWVVNIANDITKIRFYVRCDSGTTLTGVMTCNAEPSAFKLIGNGQTARSAYFRVKPSTEYYLIADKSWSIAGISNNSNVLTIYASNESLQEVLLLSQTTSPQRPYTQYRFVTPNDCHIIKVFFRGATGEAVNFVLTTSYEPIVSFGESQNLRSLRSYNGYTIPSLLLMGDPHSDSNAYLRYKEIVNYKFTPSIDGVIVLGDMASDYPTESGTYDNYNSFVSDCSIPIYPVIGNHDVGSGYGLDHYAPMSEIVNNIMGVAQSKGFIPSAPKGYYYIDIGITWNYKTRIIVLNNYNIPGTYDPDSKWEQVAYDSSAPSIAFSTSYSAGDVVNVGVWTDYSYRAKENVTTPASSPTSLVHTFPCWSVRPDYAKIDAEQAQWVLDTMASTPNYTGIVIVQHSTLATSCKKDFSSKFTQQGNVAMEVSSVGDFLVDAAKAFETKNAAFSYSVQGETVSKDFSGRTSTSSFVGFLGGHQHHDFIIRSTTYPEYYEVSANKAKSSYAGDNSDIFVPPAMPSATFVAVNRETKAMGLTKIGVDYTQDGYRRDIDLIKQETPADWS